MSWLLTDWTQYFSFRQPIARFMTMWIILTRPYPYSPIKLFYLNSRGSRIHQPSPWVIWRLFSLYFSLSPFFFVLIKLSNFGPWQTSGTSFFAFLAIFQEISPWGCWVHASYPIRILGLRSFPSFGYAINNPEENFKLHKNCRRECQNDRGQRFGERDLSTIRQ